MIQTFCLGNSWVGKNMIFPAIEYRELILHVYLCLAGQGACCGSIVVFLTARQVER